MLLGLLELIVAAVVGVVVFTQIVAPLWRGTKSFPFFRRQGTLEALIDLKRQNLTEAELEQELLELQREVKRTTRTRRAGNPPAETKE